MNVVIVGYGHVGKSVDEMLTKTKAINLKIGIYDKDPSKSTIDGIDSKEPSIVFICVPTPSRYDGSCVIFAVEESIKLIKNDPLIIIKSTIPPGTTDRLRVKYNKRIVFSPEYIGESAYWSPIDFEKNMSDTPFVIVGGDLADVEEAIDFFARIGGPYKKYFRTDAKTAELVKYWVNSFYATKVTFCNEMFEICKKFGVNFYEARDLWLNDERVARGHTMVFKDKRGYSGKCFPKDIKALVAFSDAYGYDASLLQQVIKSNEGFLEKNK